MKTKTALLAAAIAGLVAIALPAFAQEGYNGTLAFKILNGDTGKPFAAKMTFLEPDGGPSLVAAKSDDEIATRFNAIYTLSGEGEVPAPAGEVRIIASHGMEYGIAEKTVTVEPGKTAVFEATLIHEIDTAGFVSGDMHLHTLTYSGHGDANMEERIISIVAEGLDFAVATDHNKMIDYFPTIEKVGAVGRVMPYIGNEVSTGALGHWNIFPLDPTAPPTDNHLTDPIKLIENMKLNPALKIIQVNHPREGGIGYFNSIGLDPATGKPGHRRASLAFDSMEILNENGGHGWFTYGSAKTPVREDWYNFLNRGLTPAGVGNSDSHRVEANIAGVPRNFVASSTDDPAKIDAEEIAESIRNNNVAVGVGVFTTIKGPGGEPMGSLVTKTDGPVEIAIRVQSPSWVEVKEVGLVENGDVVVSWAIDADDRSPERFAIKATASPAADAWYLAYAIGDKPLAPVVRGADFPLGFSNPIWIDRDGNGKFDSMSDRAAALVEKYSNAPDKLSDAVEELSDRFAVQMAAYLAETNHPNKEALLMALSANPDEDARLICYRELAQMGGESVLPLLKGALETAETDTEKFALGSLLVAAGDYTGWDDFLEVAKSAKQNPEAAAQMDFNNFSADRYFIKDWLVLGPLDDRFDAKYAQTMPQEAKVVLKRHFKTKTGEGLWQAASADGAGWTALETLFEDPDKSLAFAYARADAPEDMNALLLVGALEKVKALVNGEEVLANPEGGSGAPGQNAAVIKLKKGANEILIKTLHANGPWGFSASLVDPTGKIKILKTDAPTPPKKD